MSPNDRNRTIFRIVVLACLAMASGVFLVAFAVSQVNAIIAPTAAVHAVAATEADTGLTGWFFRLDWTMIVVVACGSISLTCLIAITQNVISLVRAAAVPVQPDNGPETIANTGNA